MKRFRMARGGRTIVCSALLLGLVVQAPGVASADADDQEASCIATPSAEDPSGGYLFVGDGTGYPMVYPGPHDDSEWLFTQQASLRADCRSFGERSFTLWVEITFHRLRSGVWTQLNPDPLVCSVESVGDQTLGAWVAHLTVPSPSLVWDCPGSYSYLDQVLWPSTYKAFVHVYTTGVEQNANVQGFTLPWMGV